ncbi:MAG: flagellar hook protein FlgK [Myxococcaceae bacterium]|nr:flagellar hook protein FlgK [Myxococcaceae bacterium]
MSSIGSILNTGLRGMTASSGATQATANNVANSATVGYTRRSTDIYPDNSLTAGGFSSRRVIEPFIQKRILNAESGNAEASSTRASVDVLDKVYTEGDGSLGTSLDAFQVSVQNLSSNPDDTAVRQQVLATAGTLATAFQNAAQSIAVARNDSNTQITEGVAQTNQRLTQIGKLGVQIQQTEVNGVEASDLRDQRDQLLREVSQRVPISTIDQGHGQITVLLGGSQQLVSPDGTVSPLSVAPGDNGNLKIQKTVAGATVDVTSLVTSGSVGGQLKTSAGALVDAAKQLDQLAYDISNAYNTVHSAGYAQDGSTGKDLFTAPASVAGAAGAFSVSSDVAGQPQNIATASASTALPSDNGNALALSAVASAPLAIGGMTVTEALASLVGSAGSTVQDATQAQSFSSGALQQVQTLYDDTSGVSSDDEMVSMMKYQRSYQASLKVIQTADQMLNELINIRG